MDAFFLPSSLFSPRVLQYGQVPGYRQGVRYPVLNTGTLAGYQGTDKGPATQS